MGVYFSLKINEQVEQGSNWVKSGFENLDDKDFGLIIGFKRQFGLLQARVSWSQGLVNVLDRNSSNQIGLESAAQYLQTLQLGIAYLLHDSQR